MKSLPARAFDVTDVFRSHVYVILAQEQDNGLSANECYPQELDEHLRKLDEQMHEVAAYVDCVGDDCATSTTLISEYVLPL